MTSNKTRTRKKTSPTKTDQANEVTDAQASIATTDGRRREVVKVADLKPNTLNRNVFQASLSGAGLQPLVDDIRAQGIRQPIEVRPDMVILDGERRWRALRALGIDEVEVVIVEGHDTKEAVAEYILAAFSSIRNPSVDEKVRVYDLAQDVLRRKHGRPQGRPAKTDQIQADFWSPKKIKEEAAKLAGLGSATTADNALRVLKEGATEVKAKLIGGELSIDAAVRTLRPKEKTSAQSSVTAPPDDGSTPSRSSLEAPENVPAPEDRGVGSETVSEPAERQNAHVPVNNSGPAMPVLDGGSSAVPTVMDSMRVTDAPARPDHKGDEGSGVQDAAAQEPDVGQVPEQPTADDLVRSMKVLRSFLGRWPATKSAELLVRLGKEIGLTVWVGMPNEPESSIRSLVDHLVSGLDKLSIVQAETAKDICEALSSRLDQVTSASAAGPRT